MIKGKIVVFAALLVSTIILPAYGEVISFRLENLSYQNNEKFVFSGKESEGERPIFVVIRGPIPQDTSQGLVSDPSSDSDGTFSTIPRDVTDYFPTKGIYNATAFDGEGKIEDGKTIKIEYDGKKIVVVPDFILRLNEISNKVVEKGKTLEFLVTTTEDLDNLEYTLKNPPDGATINNDGKFTWTPRASQGPASYTFDIVVMKEGIEDRETIQITVTELKPKEEQKDEQKDEPESEPEPQEKEIPAPFVDPKKDPQHYIDRYNNEPSYKEWFDENYSQYESIYEAVGLEEPEPEKEIPAPFVDKEKEPQYYVDRYNNEPSYKEWFDENYSQYESIYEAVGLEEPEPQKELAPFVDPTKDPQSYVDRYLNEPSYKEWFDQNFPEYQSIYEAVGLPEPKVGICGPGTKLVEGVCKAVAQPTESQSRGGGCLIATAAYGSELAPQVQFLREIRDDTVLTTESGATFMSGFNQFYYSFSPTIADWERQSPVFKETVKIALTPMLSTLSILSFADIDSEHEMLGYGIGVILMNIGIYFAAPAIIISKGISRIRQS